MIGPAISRQCCTTAAIFSSRLPGAMDGEVQVGPEDGGRHLHHRAEPLLNLRLRLRRRGRRQGEDRRRAEIVQCGADEEIVGPEAEPPHADAVRLIDHEERDAGPLQRVQKGALPQSLRRDVDELVLARRDAAHLLAHLGAATCCC